MRGKEQNESGGLWEPKGGWQQIHPWMLTAYEHGRSTKGWFLVRRGSEEFEAWEAFFEKLEWAPWAFRRLRTGEGVDEWTAPAQWPEWVTNNPTKKVQRQRFEAIDGGKAAE